MADRWIITCHRFHQHASLEAAEAELARLREKAPKKTFRILRVKTNLQRSNADTLIADMLSALKEASFLIDEITDREGREGLTDFEFVEQALALAHSKRDQIRAAIAKATTGA